MSTASIPIAYIDDGIAMDLRHDYADVLGSVWTWTGVRDTDGQALMRCHLLGATMPLEQLYLERGPLIALPIRPTADVLRAGFESEAA